MAFSLRTSTNTLKASITYYNCMTGIAPGNLAPFLLKRAKAATEELKYHSRPLGCLKSYLFWLVAILAFLAFLCLLDLLA
jgi:hypothetical protein